MNRSTLTSWVNLVVVGCLLGMAGTLNIWAAEAESAASTATSTDWRAFLAPFHTVTLHLPIGFVVMAVILEVYWFFQPSEQLRKAIGIVLWFSAISAVVVILLGIFRGGDGGYEPEQLSEHLRFGVAVGVVTVLAAVVHSFVFRGGRNRKRFPAGIYRVLLVMDMGLLTVTGHGGGNLTHGSKYLTENAPAWAQKWIEAAEGEEEKSTVSGAGVYAEVIQPILEEKCYQCHGEEKQKGDYRMDTVEGLFTAGESELDPIVKGVAVESYLVETITLPEDDDLVMPPEGKARLTPEEIIAIMTWIWNGAET